MVLAVGVRGASELCIHIALCGYISSRAVALTGRHAGRPDTSVATETSGWRSRRASAPHAPLKSPAPAPPPQSVAAPLHCGAYDEDDLTIPTLLSTSTHLRHRRSTCTHGQDRTLTVPHRIQRGIVDPAVDSQNEIAVDIGGESRISVKH